jgi:hypothetical protein
MLLEELPLSGVGRSTELHLLRAELYAERECATKSARVSSHQVGLNSRARSAAFFTVRRTSSAFAHIK